MKNLTATFSPTVSVIHKNNTLITRFQNTLPCAIKKKHIRLGRIFMILAQLQTDLKTILTEH